jgi:hypothetical protein
VKQSIEDKEHARIMFGDHVADQLRPLPYWYALMEPVHGRRNKPEDFKKVNEVLFPNGTDALDIYEWTTDWSEFFDAGHEWYGACCWSAYDKSLNRYVVMLVSATD